MKLVHIGNLSLATLLISVLANSALAVCPEIEGNYTYKCRVNKNETASFANVLDASGKMRVEQYGCEKYQFINSITGINDVVELKPTGGDSLVFTDVKIRVSTDSKLKLLSTEYGRDFLDALSGTTQILRGKIKKTKTGFTLKGKEKTRPFNIGILASSNSKFNCEFIRE